MTKDEALKLALEALNIVKLHFTQNRHINDAIIELEQQAEQEPVACRFCHSKKGCWTWQCYNCGEIDDVQQPAPPQRQWVGLTEKEIEVIGDKVANEDLVGLVSNFRVRLARAIEQTLKERNT